VVSFSHFYDKSSPVLMAFIVKGTHFKTATIDMLKQTGKDQPELYFQFICKDVFITKASNTGCEDGAVSQDIEFVFKEMAIGYKLNNGSLEAARFFRWNVAEMTQTTSGDIKFTIS
jgi:type VI secretion system secreted protein Hcp